MFSFSFIDVDVSSILTKMNFIFLTIPEHHLRFSGFSSIFEVFTGIGFAFYGLAKLENFLNFVVDLKCRTDIVLNETIESNLQLIQTVTSANSNKPVVAELNKFEVRLNRLKADIEKGKEKILLNSRHFFLILGIHSLLLLISSGVEEYCEKILYIDCFLTATLFANVFILCWHLWFNEIFFQKDKDESIIKEVFIILLGLALFIVIGWMVDIKWNVIFLNLLVILSIFTLILPLILLLFRHRKLEKFIEKNKFKKDVDEINDHIIEIKNRAESGTS